MIYMMSRVRADPVIEINPIWEQTDTTTQYAKALRTLTPLETSQPMNTKQTQVAISKANNIPGMKPRYKDDHRNNIWTEQ